MARNKSVGIFSRYSILIFFVIICIACLVYLAYITNKETFQKQVSPDYMEILEKDKTKRTFPFRYFTDKDGKLLPFAAVTGFFRDEATKEKFSDYVKNGIHVFGITAYKTFPKKIGDGTGDSDTQQDTFDYHGKIKNWLCCFRDPTEYGFTNEHNLIEMSESDFYDADKNNDIKEKKYDFIYSCLKDADNCPLDGWNAVNRNFRLAKECFKIMIKEFGLKGLIVGRIGCGLEKEFGDKVEVTDMLDYHVFQEKLKESKFLFVPNVYDASPRVIAEAIIKDIPVLMNRHIVCGSKYIHPESGEFFKDEYDIRISLKNLLAKIGKISPKKWWEKNYSKDKAEKKLRDFLNNAFPGSLENIPNVKFVL
jgi:hypothetical protein